MILICFVTTFFFLLASSFIFSLRVCLLVLLSGGCTYMYLNVLSFSRPTTSKRCMWSEGRTQSSFPDCYAPVLSLLRLQCWKTWSHSAAPPPLAPKSCPCRLWTSPDVTNKKLSLCFPHISSLKKKKKKWSPLSHRYNAELDTKVCVLHDSF